MSLDGKIDKNNNELVEDLEQHIQWNEGGRIVELGKLAVQAFLLSQREGTKVQNVLAFKTITQSMK